MQLIINIRNNYKFKKPKIENKFELFSKIIDNFPLFCFLILNIFFFLDYYCCDIFFHIFEKIKSINNYF